MFQVVPNKPRKKSSQPTAQKRFRKKDKKVHTDQYLPKSRILAIAILASAAMVFGIFGNNVAAHAAGPVPTMSQMAPPATTPYAAAAAYGAAENGVEVSQATLVSNGQNASGQASTAWSFPDNTTLTVTQVTENGMEFQFSGGGDEHYIPGPRCVDWDPLQDEITSGTSGVDYQVISNNRMQVLSGHVITWWGPQDTIYYFNCPGTTASAPAPEAVNYSAAPAPVAVQPQPIAQSLPPCPTEANISTILEQQLPQATYTPVLQNGLQMVFTSSVSLSIPQGYAVNTAQSPNQAVPGPYVTAAGTEFTLYQSANNCPSTTAVQLVGTPCPTSNNIAGLIGTNSIASVTPLSSNGVQVTLTGLGSINIPQGYEAVTDTAGHLYGPTTTPPVLVFSFYESGNSCDNTTTAAVPQAVQPAVQAPATPCATVATGHTLFGGSQYATWTQVAPGNGVQYVNGIATPLMLPAGYTAITAAGNVTGPANLNQAVVSFYAISCDQAAA